MPLYSDGPLSKWYPSCTQACAAPPGMPWLSTTVTCRAGSRRLSPAPPSRPPRARCQPARAACAGKEGRLRGYPIPYHGGGRGGTCTPYLASSAAQHRPPRPAPTTTTSVECERASDAPGAAPSSAPRRSGAETRAAAALAGRALARLGLRTEAAVSARQARVRCMQPLGHLPSWPAPCLYSHRNM